VVWGVAATVPLLLALRWCLRTTWRPIARLIAEVNERLGPLFAGTTTRWLVLVALSAGIGEEALFRGVLQTALSDPLPTWAAIAAVSALFGVAHWVNLTYALLAGAVGAYLGVLYLVTDNLLAPIVAHALYDLIALSVLTRLKPAVSGSVV
jgi:membrane protease YdiL (CAAX protease family)